MSDAWLFLEGGALPEINTENDLQRRFEEERAARIRAEQLAEHRARELVELEQELERRTRDLTAARDAAMEASETKTRLITKVSNQLKAPLNGVLGLCNAVQNEEMPAYEPDAFRYVRIAAENLLEIVRDVLDYSDIQEGQLALIPRPVCLRELVQGALHSVENFTGDKDLWLECQVSPDVHGNVVVDRQALRRVLMNIVHNAIKFTENGTVEVSVQCVRRHDHRQLLRFAVADTGIGISEEAQKTLFDPFAASRSGSKGGSGLGLAVASRLVELMGGELKVESELGKGSRFFFEVWLEVHSGLPEQDAPLVPVSGLEILVVDDEEITRQIVMRMLENCGHKISLAADGRDALGLLRANEFDLVFMDLQMPRLDGLATTVAFRKYEREHHKSATPVIALTSSVSESERERCLEAGMNGHLMKPIRREELLRTVGRARRRERMAKVPDGPLPEVFTRVESPGRVLVVDDEPTNRKLMRNVLSSAKHTVFEASNGEQALRILETEPMDVVLLDAVMPKMDGFETCARIKSDPSLVKCQVLFVTSLEERSERIRAMDSGADDFLTKPVDTRQLKLRVRNAVQSKRMVDEIQRSYDQLQAMERLRDELAQMLVHDMRSPLTGILGYAQLLGFSEGLTGHDRGYLKTITGLCSMLREMVSSILDVSRLESDQLVLAPAPTNLLKLVKGELEVVKFLQTVPAVVNGPEEFVVNCDEELIRRVLANFISNAQKYNPDSEALEVSVIPKGETVRIEIRDHGPGVPESLRDKIFEKFAQVEEAHERKGYSSGLGLTFCKLAVEKHGGTLGVCTPEGSGSIFWFELPLQDFQ